jgi:phosphate:Na+ symporter
MVFEVTGGLAMFLYGMGMLSDGLKKAAGDRLRTMMGKVTKYPIMGLGVGTGVTCLIQSSSATTVLVVGLINAGLLTLAQAISVILGANIGTTITSWIVSGFVEFKHVYSAFKISSYALPFVAVGFVLHAFGRRQKQKNVGMIILGLGLLFLGLGFMSEGMEHLKDEQHSPLRSALVMIGDRPLLAVAAGAVFTMVIQSSSASIGMVIVLATSGAFGTDPTDAFRIAIPFVLGDNIGTTITAQLAALRSNINGKRAAMGHTLFNVVGVMIILPFVYTGWYVEFIDWIYPEPLDSLGSVAFHISAAHTAFNVTAAFVVLPFVGLLAKLVCRILPGKGEEVSLRPVVLEEHLLSTPSLAMQQIRAEILRMLRASQRATKLAVTAVVRDKPHLIKQVADKEQATDEFQTAITRYLVALSRQPLEDATANELPVLMHGVNDIERIGDHAMNIAEIAQRKYENRHAFTGEADQECRRIWRRVEEMFDAVATAIEEGDSNAAARALEDEGAVNELDAQFRDNHIKRMSEGQCHALSGLIFTDYLHNLEKIGDHLANVAQGIVGGGQWTTHQRLQQASEESDAHYQPDTDSADLDVDEETDSGVSASS